MAGIVYCIFEALLYMFTTLYFWKIDTSWRPYFFIQLCINAAALLGCFVLPESPRILLALGQEEKAIESLQMIAKFNGKELKLDIDPIEQPLLLNQSKASLNATVDRSAVVLETLQQGDVKCNLAMMAIMWSVCSFNFFLIIFLANTFEQVYMTALCMSIADVFAYIICYFLMKNVGARLTLFISMLTAAIGGLLILCFGLQNQESMLFPILFFVSKLGTTSAFGAVFTGNREIFQEEIAASSMGIC